MISSEVESLARTGGLGDVANQLSRALADAGHDVLVVTPKYGSTTMPATTRRWDAAVRVTVGQAGTFDVGVVESRLGRARALLLDVPSLFDRAGIYADAHGPFGDNELRFCVMSRAALAVAERAWDLHASSGSSAHEDVVIHAHDWHAAPAILYARAGASAFWSQVRTVFTIHNLAYQGDMPLERARQLGFAEAHFSSYILEHVGKANMMKGATALVDRITTVSHTYAREILTDEFAFGLGLHLRAHAQNLVGIENGIDTAAADPRTDTSITRTYGVDDAAAGKAANKHALMAELALESDEDKPLFANISRLSWQKGIDLVLPHVPRMVDEGARFVFVGTGDPPLEAALRALEKRYPRRVSARIGFDPKLAQRVYAASDFMIVPSRFEPCGLVQMYAMRYGSIPVVTAVGGLKDTVHEDDTNGTGIVAPRPTEADVRAALDRALALTEHPERVHAMRRRAMERDSSWIVPAAAYARLYEP